MLSLFLSLMAPGLADTVFVPPHPEADLPDAPETRLSAELGGAWASGNTDFYTLNGRVVASHKAKRNEISGQAGLNFGRGYLDADGDGRVSDEERQAGRVEIARRYGGELRYDRFLADRTAVYAMVGGLSDRYAGYDWRVHEQVGLSRLLRDDETTDIKVELGMDVAQEDYVAGVEPDRATIWAARAMFSLEHAFSEHVSMSEKVEVFENVVDLDDLRVMNEVAFSSKLSDKLAVKLSHRLAWKNVPVAGYGPLDQTALFSLVATLR